MIETEKFSVKNFLRAILEGGMGEGQMGGGKEGGKGGRVGVEGR